MRRGLLTAAAAMAITMGASDAHAAGAAYCTFNGASGSISPYVRFYGGTGSFTYDGQANCLSNGIPTIGDIRMNGQYDAQLCGAARFYGSIEIPGFGGFPFTLEIEDFVGPIWINQSGDPSGHVHFTPSGLDPVGGTCFSQTNIDGYFIAYD